MHPASSGYVYYTGNTNTVQTSLKFLWNSLKGYNLSKRHTFFPLDKSDAGTGFVLCCPLWQICAHFFASLKSAACILQSFCTDLLNQTEHSNHVEIQSHMENHILSVKEQYS